MARGCDGLVCLLIYLGLITEADCNREFKRYIETV